MFNINTFQEKYGSNKYSFLFLLGIVVFLLFPMNQYNQELMFAVGSGTLTEDETSLLLFSRYGISFIKMFVFYFTMWMIIPLAISSVYDLLAKGRSEASIWLMVKKDMGVFVVIHLLPIIISLLFTLVPFLREKTTLLFDIENNVWIFIVSFCVALFFVLFIERDKQKKKKSVKNKTKGTK